MIRETKLPRVRPRYLGKDPRFLFFFFVQSSDMCSKSPPEAKNSKGLPEFDPSLQEAVGGQKGGDEKLSFEIELASVFFRVNV